MAIKITATVIVKKRALRDQALTPEDHGTTARRVWAFLANALPNVDFVDNLTVTVEEVNKNGETKGLPPAVATQAYTVTDDDTRFTTSGF